MARRKGSWSTCSSLISLLSVPGKVFARVLLARLQPLLSIWRRRQQSGFTAGRSTIDAILALRLLSELQHEFDQPLNVVYKGSFQLCRPLCIMEGTTLHWRTAFPCQSDRGSPSGNYIMSPCRWPTLTAVWRASFGIRQGCILAPALLCAAIDWILSRCVSSMGTAVGAFRFTDQDYADDAALFTDKTDEWSRVLTDFDDVVHTMGLHTSWAKNIGRGPQPSSTFGFRSSQCCTSSVHELDVGSTARSP